jgi:DNA-binding beta-propeller fold protein YncE
MRRIFHLTHQSRRNPRNRRHCRFPIAGCRLVLWCAAGLLLGLSTGQKGNALGQAVNAQVKPDQDYLVYVLSEAADKISLVRFGPNGARVEHDIDTGDMPVDIDGPHGLAVSPDKQFYYVSLAHGRPFGSVWKYSTKDDRVLGQTTLGLFPATMDVSRDGSLLFVVNFNLHGDMVPSSVSVVATEPMLEVARIQTCAMPHGSRLNPQGTKHYSACMMDDMLVEIDTRALKVSRHFLLTKGMEM